MTVKIQYATGRGVAERWRRTYLSETRGWEKTAYGDSGVVYEKLCDLGPCPTADAVARVIGNKSWGHVTCSICYDDVDAVAYFSDGSEEIRICEACVNEAKQAFESAEHNHPGHDGTPER